MNLRYVWLPLFLYPAFLSITPEVIAEEKAETAGEKVATGRELPAPVLSDNQAKTHLFTLPAPRGLIVDRRGRVLAANRTVRRIALDLTRLTAETQEEAVQEVLAELKEFEFEKAIITPPSAQTLGLHWKHRKILPLPISAPLNDDQVKAWEKSDAKSAMFTLSSEILRHYPQKTVASHVVGYVTRQSPDYRGEIRDEEPLWPVYQGRNGVEKVHDEELTGQPGLVSMVRDEKTGAVKQQLLRPPVPGKTVVLTLDSSMQRVAEETLSSGERPGALVVLDSTSGNVLVLASWPTFNLNEFLPSITQERYTELETAKGDPFYPRAWSGVYPPGSIFKPIVALGVLERGTVHGIQTRYPCSPSMEIAGRTFRNWNDEDSGLYDVRQALMRSCNTWFYQAAIESGGAPILGAAQSFGLGTAPELPLSGVTGGNLPAKAVAEQALANLSIGQGETLVSPLQMSMAMAGLANGNFVPSPRLVQQIQGPEPEHAVLQMMPVRRTRLLNYHPYNVDLVRQGMWAVVNSPNGTGGNAAMEWPKVLGKTGTAQWTEGGKAQTLAWFSGYVDAAEPRMAYTVVMEGQNSESLSGGRNAAPLIGSFLNTIYKNPDDWGVSVPARGSQFRVSSQEPRQIGLDRPEGSDRVIISPRQLEGARESLGMTEGQVEAYRARMEASRERIRAAQERLGLTGEGNPAPVPPRPELSQARPETPQPPEAPEAPRARVIQPQDRLRQWSPDSETQAAEAPAIPPPPSEENGPPRAIRVIPVPADGAGPRSVRVIPVQPQGAGPRSVREIPPPSQREDDREDQGLLEKLFGN